jgi:hypothetical protein
MPFALSQYLTPIIRYLLYLKALINLSVHVDHQPLPVMVSNYEGTDVMIGTGRSIPYFFSTDGDTLYVMDIDIHFDLLDVGGFRLPVDLSERLVVLSAVKCLSD